MIFAKYYKSKWFLPTFIVMCILVLLCIGVQFIAINYIQNLKLSNQNQEFTRPTIQTDNGCGLSCGSEYVIKINSVGYLTRTGSYGGDNQKLLNPKDYQDLVNDMNDASLLNLEMSKDNRYSCCDIPSQEIIIEEGNKKVEINLGYIKNNKDLEKVQKIYDKIYELSR